MSSEKSPALGSAGNHYSLLLPGFKSRVSDDSLPLYTHSRAIERARVPNLRKRVILIISSLCLFLVLLHTTSLSCLSPSPSPTPILRNPAYLITADHGAVAAENKRCSDIGVDVLREGGSAVDAAISASFCVGVVNMFSCVSSSPPSGSSGSPGPTPA